METPEVLGKDKPDLTRELLCGFDLGAVRRRFCRTRDAWLQYLTLNREWADPQSSVVQLDVRIELAPLARGVADQKLLWLLLGEELRN